MVGKYKKAVVWHTSYGIGQVVAELLADDNFLVLHPFLVVSTARSYEKKVKGERLRLKL